MQTAWSVPCSKLIVVCSKTEGPVFPVAHLEQHPPYPTPRSKVFLKQYETTGLSVESWVEPSVTCWFWKKFRLLSLTAILAFLPAQTLGTGGRDNLDNVCGAEQRKRGRFLGGQVVVVVLRKKKRKTVAVKPLNCPRLQTYFSSVSPNADSTYQEFHLEAEHLQVVLILLLANLHEVPHQAGLEALPVSHHHQVVLRQIADG